MRKLSFKILGAGLALTIVASNICSFLHDGKNLDELRENVLRLHILADSDSEEAQSVKLDVRDAVLRRSSEIFGDASDMEEACENAQESIGLIEKIAGETLAENDFFGEVSAEITDMYFDERTYGDITMPAGEYKALRIKIGSAKGRNWWCVMYPPLCIPAACRNNEESTASQESETVGDSGTETEFFTDEQCDILCNPVKYKVRFAIWDKIKSIFDL